MLINKLNILKPWLKMAGFDETYRNFVQTNGQAGTIIELEKIFIAEFMQDKSPLYKRIENACARLQDAYDANIFPEGDPRRIRNLFCYSRLNDKVREFGK